MFEAGEYPAACGGALFSLCVDIRPLPEIPALRLGLLRGVQYRFPECFVDQSVYLERSAADAPARSRARTRLRRLPGGVVLGDATPRPAPEERPLVKNPCTEALTSPS